MSIKKKKRPVLGYLPISNPDNNNNSISNISINDLMYNINQLYELGGIIDLDTFSNIASKIISTDIIIDEKYEMLTQVTRCVLFVLSITESSVMYI